MVLPPNTHNGPSFPQGPKPNPIASPYLELEKEYEPLFRHSGIENVNSPDGPLPRLLDVPMDKVAILKVENEEDALGTSGVATCIAICGRGTNPKGDTFLTLCHKSSVCDSRSALSIMHDLLGERGCLFSNIEMFAIGGQWSNENNMGTINDEKDVLDHAESYQIKGVRLHLFPYESDGVEVVITKDNVRFSEKNIFDPIEISDAEKEYKRMIDVSDSQLEDESCSEDEDDYNFPLFTSSEPSGGLLITKDNVPFDYREVLNRMVEPDDGEEEKRPSKKKKS